MMNSLVRKYAVKELSISSPTVEFTTTTANNEFYIVKGKCDQFAVKTTSTDVVDHVKMDKYDLKDIKSGFKSIDSLF